MTTARMLLLYNALSSSTMIYCDGLHVKGCFGLAPAGDDSVWWSFNCTIYSKTSLHIYNFLPSLAFTCSL